MLRFLLIYAEFVTHLLCVSFFDFPVIILAVADWATQLPSKVTGAFSKGLRQRGPYLPFRKALSEAVADCWSMHSDLHFVFTVAREIVQ